MSTPDSPSSVSLGVTRDTSMAVTFQLSSMEMSRSKLRQDMLTSVSLTPGPVTVKK
jgi:hypothetical protein